MSTTTVGICCYCGEECNVHAQSCGRCSRYLTNYYLGHDLPPYLSEQRFTEEELNSIKEQISETKKSDNK